MNIFVTTVVGLALAMAAQAVAPNPAAAASSERDIAARMETLNQRMADLRARTESRTQQAEARSASYASSQQSVAGMAQVNGVPMNFGGWSFLSIPGAYTRSYTFTVTNGVSGSW